jgi:Protein of unknown function (DUF4231)
VRRKRRAEVAVVPEHPELAHSAAWKRLEDQISWYDRKSTYNQRQFKAVKVAQIVVAALVPILAAADAARALLGALGAVVLILEGFQQLFQYQQNWLTYRSTCESLKHEKYLFLSAAGSYANALRPQALLSERVEGLVSQEHAKWTAAQEELRVHERVEREPVA